MTCVILCMYSAVEDLYHYQIQATLTFQKTTYNSLFEMLQKIAKIQCFWNVFNSEEVFICFIFVFLYFCNHLCLAS